MAVRLANVAKIKAELKVDTFLPADDPRQLYEDITEKFDHCFWFGDLNCETAANCEDPNVQEEWD